jgi:type I restriction enzyme S subunit
MSGKQFVDTGYEAFGAGGMNGYLPVAEFHRPGIVLSSIGARCGKCFLAKGEWTSLANTQIIFPDPQKADIRFVWYQLNDEERWPRSGAAQPFIRPSDIKVHEVRLPPLDEQWRIVAVLDEAFAAIATATANAEKNLANARALFGLTVNQVIGCGYPEAAMEALCSFENGDRGENYAGRAAFVDQGIPIINAGHLTQDGIDVTSMNFITRERFNLLRSGKIRRGDILFCLRGSLGKFAYNDLYDEGAIASSLIIVRPNESILPEYLCLYLASDQCLNMIKYYENGAAQPNLGGKSLEKFLVPVPNLREQQQVVDRLKTMREATRDMETVYANKIAHLAELKQALLHRAFAGEMTAQKPLAA